MKQKPLIHLFFFGALSMLTLWANLTEASEKPGTITVDPGDASRLKFWAEPKAFGNTNWQPPAGVFVMVQASSGDAWLRIEAAPAASESDRYKPENVTIVVDRPCTVTQRKDGKYVITFTGKPPKPGVLPAGMWRAGNL